MTTSSHVIKVETTEREQMLDITRQVSAAVARTGIGQGIALIASQHTTAGITVQEGADPDVQRDMIQHLVNLTIEDGQLEECPITLKELYAIVETFTDVLLGIYHHRIEYPGLPAKKHLGEEVPRSAIITLEVPNPLKVANSDDEPNRQ